MVEQKKPRLKTCRVCKTKFTPWRTTQVACSPSCALAVAELTRTRREKQETRKRLEAIEPISKLEKRAERAVNHYVRLRDYYDGCISCHLPASWNGQWHASHFRSVGAASSIRFNLWNIHKSCSVCNNWKSGNIGDYEPRLRDKIGNDKVDWLKQQNQPRKYTREYLIRLSKVFNKRCRILEKRISKSLA